MSFESSTSVVSRAPRLASGTIVRIAAVCALAVTLLAVVPSGVAGASGGPALLAGPSEQQDQFGSSVAISSDGSTAVVGASWGPTVSCADNTDPYCVTEGTGEAFVYTNVGGSWSLAQTLTDPAAMNYDAFGSSVAVSSDGSTIVVGADANNAYNGAVGSAYIYQRGQSTWSLARSFVDPGGSQDAFGSSVAASGSVVAIGAPYSNSLQGTAFVSTLSNGTWSGLNELSLGIPGAQFVGGSVSLDDTGSTLVVGSSVGGMEYVPQGTGYAYNGISFAGGSVIDGAGTEVVGVSLPNQVNVFDPATGKQINSIVAPDATAGDGFGTSVAVDDAGVTVVVGAPYHPYNQTQGSNGPGEVYEFNTIQSSETGELADPQGISDDSFGNAVGVASPGVTPTIVVGSPHAPITQQTGGPVDGPGLAYVDSGSLPPPPNFLTISVGTASHGVETATAGAPLSLQIDTSGSPTPSLKESGKLPAGVSFTDNGNGTGTLTGTPGASSGGTFQPKFTATFGTGKDKKTGSLTLVLTVDQSPAITSKASVKAKVGAALAYSVTTSGTPRPSIVASGSLPAGITLVDHGNGTATLGGTPDAGSGGTYSVTVTAANGVGAPAHQALTVAVDQAPSITTASSDSVTAGQPFTYTVSADGFPAASLSSSGPKVAGVKFTNDKNGTGTYSGTPTAPGNYTFTVTAKNAAGTGTQTFTLQVTG